MQFVIDFIALALAADAITTAWFYGSICKNLRERLIAQGGLFGELMGCSLCLSFHICFWLALLLWAPAQFLPMGLSFIPRIVLYGLATTDLVHWLQGDRPIPVEEE